jgi:hypothetical protein
VRARMRQSCGVVFLLLGWGRAARGQSEFVQHQSTGVPSSSRYEIVQSSLVVRFTFRVDRYLGAVDQLVMTEDSALTWQPMVRHRHPNGEPRRASQVNYQLFLSGIAVRHTYLMNLNNGATWQLVMAADSELVWSPLIEQAYSHALQPHTLQPPLNAPGAFDSIIRSDTAPSTLPPRR